MKWRTLTFPVAAVRAMPGDYTPTAPAAMLDQSPLDVTCSDCWAEPGQPCYRTSDGRTMHGIVHAVRGRRARTPITPPPSQP